MHDGAPAVGSQGAPPSEAEPALSTPAPLAQQPEAEAQTILVGRLRRWSSKKQWGYVFSELHNADLILCASEGSDTFEEGDFIFFEPVTDDQGQLSAKNARKASHDEVTTLQAQLSSTYQTFHNRRFKQVENLTSGSRRNRAAYSTSGHEASQAAVTPGGMAPQHLEQSLRPPPPPPAMPPVQDVATAGSAEVFATTTNMSQPNYHQQQLHPQAQAYSYNSYVDDGRNYYHQGMDQPWQGQGMASTNSTHQAMNSNNTLLINEQVPNNAVAPGTKLLLEAPPLLENGFNAKHLVSCLKGINQVRKSMTFPSRNGLAAFIGREFGDLLRSTHHTFCNHSGEEMYVSAHTQANAWGHQQWDWGWNQGHGDQMGHASGSINTNSVGHASMGHGVLSTQGSSIFGDGV